MDDRFEREYGAQMQDRLITPWGEVHIKENIVVRKRNGKVESAEFREITERYPEQVRRMLNDFHARLEQLEINLERLEERLEGKNGTG